MTTPPVTFDFAAFVGIFPEFQDLGGTLAQAFFTRATGTVIANACSNPANADGNLAYLVYLATAHVAWLNCPMDPTTGLPSASGNPSTSQVGRVSSAGQGSVSVQLEWPLDGSSSAQEKYLAQTKYGVEYWKATAQYRTAQYAAQPTRVAGTGRYFRRGLWGGW